MGRVRQTDAGAEVATLELARRVWEIEHLCAEIEDRALIVRFRGRKVERVSCTDVQGETRRNPPVVSKEDFGNMGTRLYRISLNVDVECIDLPQQERGEWVAASVDSRVVASGCSEGERPRGIGRIENVQGLAADVETEFDRVTPPHQCEGVQILCDGRRKPGVAAAVGPIC